MAYPDLNGMIEGDFMYVDHLNLQKEDVFLISDKESTSDDIDQGSVLLDDTDDEIQVISCKIKATQKEDTKDEDIEIIDSDLIIACTSSMNKSHLSSDHINEPGQSSQLGSDTEFKNHQTETHTNVLPKETKKRFVSKDLIDLYCNKCNKINTKLKKTKRSQCQTCKTTIKYRCTQCHNNYKTFQKAFVHVKFQCDLAKNCSTFFHCSMCYYDTRSKKNLENHILNQHTVEKCINCDKECENSQMAKHKFFECTMAAPNPVNTKDVTETSLSNIKKRRGRKPKYATESTFLNKYCKSCDVNKEMMAGGEYATCRDCSAVLLHQCITCNKRFQKLLTAKIHVRYCNYPRRFQCSDCDYQTAYKTSLISHHERKHEQKECEVCLQVCDNNLSLRNHEKYDCKFHPRFRGPRTVTKLTGRKNSSPRTVTKLAGRKNSNTFNALKLYCSRCKESFDRTSPMLSTCKRCNSKVQLQCAKCQVLFNHFGTGYRHIKRGCKLESYYKCRECDYRISSKKVLLDHMRIQHADSLNTARIAVNRRNRYKKCPECHGNNFDEESFDAHLEQCKLLPSFQCSSCSFSTKKSKNLREHFRNIHIHGQSYFPCFICKKKFKYSSLGKHRRKCEIVHNKNKN